MKKSNKYLTLKYSSAILKLLKQVKISKVLPSFNLVRLNFAAKNSVSRIFVENRLHCLFPKGMQKSLSFKKEAQLWLFHLYQESG